MTEEDETHAVLAANARFYRAFNERNVAAMAELWAERAPVACLHPGEPLLAGRPRVLRRWQDRRCRMRQASADAQHAYGTEIASELR